MKTENDRPSTPVHAHCYLPGDPIENVNACPKCGCEKTETSGNRVEYPQVWQTWWCENCGWKVAEADNGPVETCYEWPDYVIGS